VSAEPHIALGFDPGLASTGWAAVDISQAGRPELRASGVIKTVRACAREVEDTHARIIIIGAKIGELLESMRPHSVAIEAFVSYGKLVTSAFQLASVIGLIIEACRYRGIPSAQYRAVDVAAGIAGSSRASKEERERAVRAMVRHPEGVSFGPGHHAADAIAVTLLHAISVRGKAMLRAAAARTGAQ